MKISLLLSACFTLVTLVAISTPEIQSAADFSSENVESSMDGLQSSFVGGTKSEHMLETLIKYKASLMDVFRMNDLNVA